MWLLPGGTIGQHQGAGTWAPQDSLLGHTEVPSRRRTPQQVLVPPSRVLCSGHKRPSSGQGLAEEFLFPEKSLSLFRESRIQSYSRVSPTPGQRGFLLPAGEGPIAPLCGAGPPGCAWARVRLASGSLAPFHLLPLGPSDTWESEGLSCPLVAKRFRAEAAGGRMRASAFSPLHTQSINPNHRQTAVQKRKLFTGIRTKISFLFFLLMKGASNLPRSLQVSIRRGGRGGQGRRLSLGRQTRPLTARVVRPSLRDVLPL